MAMALSTTANAAASKGIERMDGYLTARNSARPFIDEVGDELRDPWLGEARSGGRLVFRDAVPASLKGPKVEGVGLC